jgi:hypothetical protein
MMLPTSVLVGIINTGKSFLAKLAVLIVGVDRPIGCSFSYNAVSEFELGKATLRGTVPVVSNDPPKEYAKGYADLVQHVADGDRQKTRSLDYQPGGGIILCINLDFLKMWWRTDPQAWYVNLSYTSLNTNTLCYTFTSTV